MSATCSSSTDTDGTKGNGRFTRDGSGELEAHLSRVCEQVLEGVRGIVPRRRLEAVVLGGGYGRGEGGVLKTAKGDQPYNDLEFYVFTRGNRLLNDRSYRGAFAKLGDDLSSAAGLHVEFKIDSLTRLRNSLVSMFSYDLVSAHRIIYGPPKLFAGCNAHLNAAAIPLSEATRLLFNRCTGLLLARELLQGKQFGPEEADFVARNIAKAQLAVGDALLVVAKQYHWSCLERGLRLKALALPSLNLCGLDQVTLQEVVLDHATGAEFKLHPFRSKEPATVLRARHTRISALGQKVWLAIEKLRLGKHFADLVDYALAPMNKCAETHPMRNLLLNLNTFGVQGVLDGRRFRYPRERLLNSLPLLLWESDGEKPANVIGHLQRNLFTEKGEWPALVAAYKQIWPSYG